MSLSPLYSVNINTNERCTAVENEGVQNTSSAADCSVFMEPSYLEYTDGADTFETQNSEFNNVEDLYNDFLETKEHQGLIGKAWDGIKNLFHLKNSSDNVENIIKQAQNGEISQNEASERLNAYKEGQKMCVDVAGDIISGIAAVGAAVLAPVTGGASLLVAAGAGAVVKTAIKAGDSAISGREYKLTDLGYDIITGSINGLMAPLSNAIGGAAGTGVAKALGLEAVETCAKSAAKEAGEAGIKQAGKSFLTKLLAKQGASYVAKEGAKGGITLLAAKAAAYGVDMTIDGALSGATDAFARALAEGRIEDIPDDMARGAVGGAIGGLAIGGSTRLIFSGASKLNNRLFGSLTESVPDSGVVKSFDTSFAFSNLSDEAKSLINSTPQIKAFYSSLDNETISHLTSKQIAEDLADENFIKGLSIDFSNGIKAGSDEASALAAVISRRNAYLEDSAVRQFKNATNGTDVTYYDRPKGFNSTLDKLNDKIAKQSAASFDDVNAFIADGVGTRAVFNSLTKNQALKVLKDGGLSTDDIKILKNLWTNTDYSTLSEAQTSLLIRANNILAEAQTQEFVDRLAKALSNNEISMTEINNYAAQDGYAYFTERQIKQLRDAWLESSDAENGAQLKVVTKLSKDSELAAELGFDDEYIKSIGEKSSKPSGYTACHTNFVYKNGAFGEGQLRGTEIQQFAEYEHFPYDIKKGKSTVDKKIVELTREGNVDVANQLIEYQNLVSKIVEDENIYGQYDNYLKEVYNYLRKKELGILDILGDKAPAEPVLNLDSLSAYQNELLSKNCLEALSKKQVYNFVNGDCKIKSA